MKVKFYYSSKDKPGEQYPCNTPPVWRVSRR